MPTYEMPLLLQLGKRSEYASLLKAVAETIFSTGGFIRKIENWGEKELPCKASNHGKVHKQAGHFLLAFDVPPSATFKILDECQRNVKIVRSVIYLRSETPEQVECTFEEELLPPPYRPSVQKMIAAGEKRAKKVKQFQHNSGLDYYPFLK